MAKPKIVNIEIDEDNEDTGITGIALVEIPAHYEQVFLFNKNYDNYVDKLYDECDNKELFESDIKNNKLPIAIDMNEKADVILKYMDNSVNIIKFNKNDVLHNNILNFQIELLTNSENYKNLINTELKYYYEQEKREIVGPLIIPDLDIPRASKEYGVYYTRFSVDTINTLLNKLMANPNSLKNLNIGHTDKKVKDVYVKEIWILEDPNKDKINKYTKKKYPIGTLMATFKINNEEVWEMLKDNKLNGYSIEVLVN